MLFILSILAVTAYSSMNTDSFNVVTEHERLKSVLRYAQMYAMKDEFQWRVDVDADQYTLQRVTNTSGATQDMVIPGIGTTHELGRVSVTSGTGIVSFDSRGRPYLDGNLLSSSHTISLKGTGSNDTLSINITAVTGYIR